MTRLRCVRAPMSVVLLVLAAAWRTAAASEGEAEPSGEDRVAVPPPCRERLTGDWRGRRTCLEERGVTLDLDLTGFAQGALSGARDEEFDVAARMDFFASFDTAKLGLWCGGGFHAHVASWTGDLDAYAGGGLSATNTALIIPSEADELVATSLYATQEFGEHVSVMVGKIDAGDLVEEEPFFGGWGTRRFMNVAFAATPTGAFPSVIMGGVATVTTDPFEWSLLAYDPHDRTLDYAPGDLFEDGVVVSLGGTWTGKLAGRTSSVYVQGTYSTRDGADLSDVRFEEGEGLTVGTREGSWSASAQVGHLLCEREGPPESAWGVFAVVGLADGNPNPIRAYVVGGIGGTGLFGGRPRDGFGVGYFYYAFSDDLESALSPLLDLRSEQGLEVYYDAAITPFVHLTGDVQWIDPAFADRDDALVVGLRVNVRF